MAEIRRAIARIMERHLDEIVQHVIDAYRTELPRFAEADDRSLDATRLNLRRAGLAFIGVYANPGSHARELLDQARRATVDQTRERFSRDETLEMLRVARHVSIASVRAFLDAELGPEGDPGEVQHALDAFLDELARDETEIELQHDPIDRLLSDAELEEPDIL